MRIQNLDGTARFELEILGYEFPNLEHDMWDANWLLISGKMVTPARSWQFVDPCLVTMEAHELAKWFADLGTRRPAESRIDFTEPNLSFEWMPSDSQTVELRLYLACNSLPPGVDTGDEEFFEPFHVTREELRDAANELCRAIANYPVRAGADHWSPPCREC